MNKDKSNDFNKLISEKKVFFKSVNSYVFKKPFKNKKELSKKKAELSAGIGIDFVKEEEDIIYIELLYAVVSYDIPIDINVKLMIALKMEKNIKEIKNDLDMKKINYNEIIKNENIISEIDKKISLVSTLFDVTMALPSTIFDSEN